MSATSASRLGLDIGAYDQVIALSQDNINETLQYHYDNHEELKTIKTRLEVGGNRIKGKIDAPKIELIDREGADQAFYCLVFSEGNYSYLAAKEEKTNDPEDSDAPPPVPTFVYKTVPLEGWKLAFYVDFAMKKMDIVPDKIRSQINLPGSYGVDQLLIDFGTADTMSFNWDHSELANFDDKKSELAARDSVSLLIAKWLTDMKSAAGNHNVLGYAVKIKPEQSRPDPSFPPTAVRLQTVNHRPGGEADKASPSLGKNAFLFTEMTGKDGPDRLQATKDLPWSGDFFYQSFGGTLIMSRSVFWDNFVKTKLNDVNALAVKALNTAAKDLAPAELAEHVSGWWLSNNDTAHADMARATNWTSTNGLNEEFRWSAQSHHNVEHEVSGPNHVYDYSVSSEVNHTLRPEVGTGNFYLDYNVTLNTILTIGLGGFLSKIANFTAKTTCSYPGTVKVSLTAADSGGGLHVAAMSTSGKPTIAVDANMGGIAKQVIDAIPGIAEKYGGNAEAQAYKDAVITVMASSVEAACTTAESLQEALSGQKRFVFPGGGTFDMKSPIFSNRGDLLVGLSYRKGDLV